MAVNESSPLHTELLKRGPRQILSSSEEEDGVCQPPKAHTPCGSSRSNYSISGLSPRSVTSMPDHKHQDEEDAEMVMAEDGRSRSDPSPQQEADIEQGDGMVIEFNGHASHGIWKLTVEVTPLPRSLREENTAAVNPWNNRLGRRYCSMASIFP